MRLTIVLALCVIASSLTSTAFARPEPREINLPILEDRTGIDQPDLPLKELTAALASHPHARIFRIGYATLAFLDKFSLGLSLALASE